MGYPRTSWTALVRSTSSLYKVLTLLSLYYCVTQIPREKGEGRAARQSANNSSNTSATAQPSSTPPTPTAMTANGVPAAAATANWERGYTPNANWAPAAQPAVVNGGGPEVENQWAAGYQPDAYDPSTFNFNPLQQGSFHPPAPVVDTFTANGQSSNGFRPRPSPQPVQQIQIGGFSPHMTSPHPSPGSGQQMNGRCGSVPPHFTNGGGGQENGYMNGSPFTSPSPRPPSSNNPPGESFRNGSTESNGLHPNGPPGYPSPSPIPHSHSSNGGYPGQQQQQQGKAEPWEPGSNEPKQQRSTPHEELNNRLKEKILSKQQMQQQQQQQHSFQQQQHELPTNGQSYYMNYPYQNNEEYQDGGHFNPTSASSPSSSTGNVRLDVHLEPNSTAHFLGPAHPQNGGTGGGNPGGQEATNEIQTSPATSSPPRSCQVHHLSASAADPEQDRLSKLKNNLKDEVPPCQCFPTDQCKSPVRWKTKTKKKYWKRKNSIILALTEWNFFLPFSYFFLYNCERSNGLDEFVCGDLFLLHGWCF